MPSATTLRYVPQGSASLSSDAPGWSAAAAPTEEGKGRADGSDGPGGPACWKCRGARSLPLRKKQKPRSDRKDSSRTCPVCKGEGRLPVKSKLVQSRNECGAITSRRRRPRGWVEGGHVPPAVQAALALHESTRDVKNGGEGDAAAETVMDHAISLLARANGRDDDYDTKREDVPVTTLASENASKDFQGHHHQSPPWLPINPGEQLCNLVGRWRILQRVASHRWTTDDLVTAYIAASAFVSSLSRSSNHDSGNDNAEGEKTTIRFLDLGTGNASVLQMATWYVLSRLERSRYELEAVGVEARCEAVGLARRSLSFNLGPVEYGGEVYIGGIDGAKEGAPMDSNVRIVNGDFRDLASLSTNEEGDSSSRSEMGGVASRRYDLVTGTPPYFRVDFASSEGSSASAASGGAGGDGGITSAVIRQGGMPTSMQSAPARCEFRGGVEAYCLAASAMLKREGLFVVCENWLNDDRVWRGADEAGLRIECVRPVVGREGRGNLFAVYVMRKESEARAEADGGIDGSDRTRRVRPPLVVRDENGKWTDEYVGVLDGMSVPVV